MDWEEFWDPGNKKLILFLILFIIVTLWHQLLVPVDYWCHGFSCPQWGFPFAFLISGPCPVTTPFTCLQFSLFKLLLDIIICYSMACLVFFYWNKFRGKIPKPQKKDTRKKKFFKKGWFWIVILVFILFCASLFDLRALISDYFERRFSPSELSFDLSAPSSVNIGEKFNITAQIENAGGLPAKDVIITLFLPSGLLTKENLNKTISKIPGYSTITVTWPVEPSEGCSYQLEARLPDWNKLDIAEIIVMDESSHQECTKHAGFYGGFESIIPFQGTESKDDCYKIEEQLKEECIKSYSDALNKILDKEIEYSGWLDYYEEKDAYSICGNCLGIGSPYEIRKAPPGAGGPCCCCYWLRSKYINSSRYRTIMENPVLTIRGMVRKTRSAQEGNCSISYGCDRLFFEVKEIVEQ